MTIKGSNGELVIRQTEDLSSNRRFNILCLQQLNRSFAPVRAVVWAHVLEKALRGIDEVHADETITDQGRFLEHLTDYLTDRSRGQRKDLPRRPWECEDRRQYWFSLEFLEKHMLTTGAKDMLNRKDYESWIRQLGGNRVSRHAITLGKGRGSRLWYVPSHVIREHARGEPGEPPPVPDQGM